MISHTEEFTRNKHLYPNGFHKYPLPVLRHCKQLTRTLAAFWSLKEVRRSYSTTAGLDHVARLSGLPLGTLEKHVARLTDRGAIINRGLTAVTPTVWKARYQLSAKIANRFEFGEWLLVPTHWERDHFAVQMVRAYYFYRCGVWNDCHSYCVESLEKIAKQTGLSIRSIKSASKQLTESREIIRRNTPNLNFAVSIPDFEPDYPLSQVLAGHERHKDARPTDGVPNYDASPYALKELPYEVLAEYQAAGGDPLSPSYAIESWWADQVV